jgi:hypothetical protein
MPEFLQEISHEDYIADKVGNISLSSGIAKILLNKSPRHAWIAHPRLNPKWQPHNKKEFDIGTAAHALLLEGKQSKICVIDAEDWRTKAAKEQRDEAYANGLTPLLAKHNVAVNRMVDAAKEYIEQTHLKGIFDNGKPEQTVTLDEAGVSLKGRLDWITNDRRIVLDYKTTGDASPDAFSRQISRMGYDIQEQFYLRILAGNGCEDTEFYFLAQEDEYPHLCSLHRLHPSMQEYGAVKVQQAIDLWRKCMESGKWPGYPTDVCYTVLSNWQMAEMERIMEERENGI